ncbi:MAG: alpha/beta hydrolase [Proteobacteria bacterium]|nr:alpha/beta hydrolase [Pseudomonadota bacterium]
MGIEFVRANGRALLVDARVPPRLRPRPVAVLLCNPFGEEAVRAHRALRVLAQRLEAAGYPVMRFDYAGTGDSEGDSDRFGLDDWVDDVLAAAADLRARSGVQKVALLGLRLGATLATLAARRGDARIAHLLLWDPVVDGAGYLDELGRAHRAYLREETGRAPPDEGIAAESLGMPLPAGLRAALAEVDLAAGPPQVPLTTAVATRDTPELRRLREVWGQAGAALHWIAVDDAPAWNSDAAFNSAIVPINEVLALVGRIETCHP